jgi:exodeoxyribonuclease VIII
MDLFIEFGLVDKDVTIVYIIVLIRIKTMAKDLMVDLETMAVTPNAVILTLGAVHFDPYGSELGDSLYLRFDLDDQDFLKREVDPNTLTWWSKQDAAVMEEAFSSDNRVPIKDAMDQFHKFAWGCRAFWSHGSVFDIVILENLFTQLEKSSPWNFWQVRDTRTLFDLGQTPDMPKDAKHNALEDAKRQAIGVQNVYRKLNVTKRT